MQVLELSKSAFVEPMRKVIQSMMLSIEGINIKHMIELNNNLEHILGVTRLGVGIDDVITVDLDSCDAPFMRFNKFEIDRFQHNCGDDISVRKVLMDIHTWTLA